MITSAFRPVFAALKRSLYKLKSHKSSWKRFRPVDGQLCGYAAGINHNTRKRTAGHGNRARGMREVSPFVARFLRSIGGVRPT